jgi:hypothetical protein
MLSKWIFTHSGGSFSVTLLRIKSWLAKTCTNKRIRLVSDVVFLVATSYLMLRKLTEFSLTGWLINNAFQQPLINAFVLLAVIIIVICIMIKITTIYFDTFPPLNHGLVEPDEISNCLFRINSEISDHLQKCNGTNGLEMRSICDQHGFKVNAALVVDSMAEHIRKSIKSIQVKRKDLFISLYYVNDESGCLEYMLHYDSKRDLVESKSINLSAKKFEGYESVKCIKSSNTTAYVLNKRDYVKGASKRNKTIEHYIGCKITSEQRVFAFLNIEFHNNAIFPDELAMQDFLEEHVYPFKLLLEYQFLKKEFFSHLKNLDFYRSAA